MRENLSSVLKVSRVWLIGGTSESAKIAEAIAVAKIPCTITVTTSTAQSLYPHPDLRIRVGQLDRLQMETFCAQESIVAIVDASHPFAVAISQAAITLATKKQIPYLRYERPNLRNRGTKEAEGGDGGMGGWGVWGDEETKKNNSNCQLPIQLESFETLLEGNYLLGQRVLLTIGYKALPLFQAWQHRATLFARLLPTLNSIEVAMAAGFTPERLIAIRPPISAELEKALWYQWQISLVVTKASGQAGGEDIKQFVAAELRIPLIVIARPKVTYPQQTNDLSEVLSFCRQHFGN